MTPRPGLPRRPPRQREGDPGKEGAAALRHAAEIKHGATVSRSGHGWWPRWSWIVLIGTVLASYVVAGVYKRDGSTAERFVDSLRIFPSSFPGYDSAERWQYNLARYVAAAVFLLGSARVLTTLLSDRFAEARASRRRRHAVVCGLDEIGVRCVQYLASAGVRVTCLDVAPSADHVAAARDAGAIVLVRDATDRTTLERVGAHRARHVVCACDDDTTNTQIAGTVAMIAHAGGRADAPNVYVKVTDLGLLHGLRGRLATVGLTRLYFFNPFVLWSRLLLDSPDGPFVRGVSAPKISVIGSGPLAEAIVVGAARRWHRVDADASEPTRATIRLIAADANRIAKTLHARYPRLGARTDLEPVEEESLAAVTSTIASDDVVYMCTASARDDLVNAVELDRRLAGAVPILLAKIATGSSLAGFLAETTNIHPVSLPGSLSTDLMQDMRQVALAREVHETFLATRRSRPDFGTRPADVPWEELAPRVQETNYRHAEAMIEQLRSVWLEIDDRTDWDEPPYALPDELVEALAQMEHARWCRELIAEGWTWAASRDEKKRMHDQLLPWNQLSADSRELNGALVRARPAMFARADLALRPSSTRDRLARQLHEDYLASEAAAGRTPQIRRSWAELDEAERQWNRASVDHIAVKLAAVGCRVAPRALGPRREVALTAQDIELLARMEHERWMQDRLASGWTVGARDDAARTHPSLVEWDKLPASEQDKDRNVVSAIPRLLASVGLIVVRDAA